VRDWIWTARQAIKRAFSNLALIQAIKSERTTRAAMRFAYGLTAPRSPPAVAPAATSNPLLEYFDSVTEGPGIWKWRHYFAIYHRHLAKFVGREVHVVEIGVYSGGSLAMWRSYFGDGCQVYGVDIAPECRAYEGDGIRVFIGDQADPAFWERFCQEVPRIDVVIDDGGHEAHQQITSLRCLLPHLAMGGVYICEDIIGPFQQFNAFVDGMARALSDVGGKSSNPSRACHEHVASVHRYPQIVVFEKPDGPVESFDSIKHGTIWQPSILK
jgi:cephalosporin hydroxylase